MFDVIGFGENSIDYVYRVPAIPAGGAMKLRIESRMVQPGGQVATAMAACRALGLNTGYVGTFGSDEAAALAREALQRRGIDLTNAITRNGSNRYAVILVDPAGERMILWHRDEALRVSTADVRPEWLAHTRLLHVDATSVEASIVLATHAREKGLEVSCDVDEVTPQTRELLRHTTLAIVAEGVPEKMAGDADPARALRAMWRDRQGMIAVTLGARGSLLLAGDEIIQEPAVPVTVVDTTGAGDVFRAGFIYGALQGWEPRRILRFANAAAAFSCTREGAMNSVPSLDAVARLLGG